MCAGFRIEAHEWGGHRVCAVCQRCVSAHLRVVALPTPRIAHRFCDDRLLAINASGPSRSLYVNLWTRNQPAVTDSDSFLANLCDID